MPNEQYDLVIPGTPPSLNSIGTRGHRYATTAAKKQWEGNLMIALLQAKVPKPLPRVRCSAALRFKDSRRRDAGNYSWLLDKALGDILQKGGWITDDTPDIYEFEKVSFDPDRGDPTTAVRIEVIREEVGAPG